MNVSPIDAISERAFSSTASAPRDSCGVGTDEPDTDGSAARMRSAALTAPATVVPAASSSAGVVVSACSARALSTCAGSIWGCPCAAAARVAAAKASLALVVSCRSMECGYLFQRVCGCAGFTQDNVRQS